jgi:hypothetical protein
MSKPFDSDPDYRTYIIFQIEEFIGRFDTTDMQKKAFGFSQPWKKYQP